MTGETPFFRLARGGGTSGALQPGRPVPADSGGQVPSAPGLPLPAAAGGAGAAGRCPAGESCPVGLPPAAPRQQQRLEGGREGGRAGGRQAFRTGRPRPGPRLARGAKAGRRLPPSLSLSAQPASGARGRRDGASGAARPQHQLHPLDQAMTAAMGNLTDSWLQKLDSVLKAFNQTLHRKDFCPQDARRDSEEMKETYAYMYILFVMILFAVTVGSLILGYTRSGKEVDKQSDPYHVYIKNRVSMI